MPGLLILGAAPLLACHNEKPVLVVADAGNQRIDVSAPDRTEPKEVE